MTVAGAEYTFANDHPTFASAQDIPMRTLIIVIATIALTALGVPNLHDVAYAQSDL